MQKTTEIICVNGRYIKMSISRERCLEALRQLMLAETYPELTTLSNTKAATKKVRQKTDSSKLEA